jgi:ribosomal protein S19E (S16A)
MKEGLKNEEKVIEYGWWKMRKSIIRRRVGMNKEVNESGKSNCENFLFWNIYRKR